MAVGFRSSGSDLKDQKWAARPTGNYSGDLTATTPSPETAVLHDIGGPEKNGSYRGEGEVAAGEVVGDGVHGLAGDCSPELLPRAACFGRG